MSLSNLFENTQTQIIDPQFNLKCDTLEILGNGTHLNTSLGCLIIHKGMTLNGKMNLADITEITNTTNATSETTGSLIVSGGVGVAKDLYVGGTLTATNIIYKSTEIVTNTSDSTSVSTGALVVSGGAGIQKNLNIGGNFKVFATTQATDTLTGSLQISGGASIAGDLRIGGTLYSNLSTSTIQSTDTQTGSIIVTGGLGIAKRLNVGEYITAPSMILNANTPSTNETTGSLVVSGGLGVSNNINVTGNATIGGVCNIKTCQISSLNDATNTLTGALNVAGGFGVQKSAYFGGSVIIENTVNSSDTLTGSILIKGGVGIQKTLCVPQIYINSNDTGNSAKLIINNPSATQLDLTDGTSTVGFRVTAGELRLQKSTGSGILHTMSTTQSVSTVTGNIITNGGVGIAKRLNVGEYVTIYDTTQSTSSSTGALMIAGGLGVCKNINADGNIYMNGALLNGIGNNTIQTYGPASSMTMIDNVQNFPSINDPSYSMYMIRSGSSGNTYASGARFGLSRYETGLNGRTRFDIDLAHDNNVYTNALKMLSNGDITTIGNIQMGSNKSIHINGTNSPCNLFVSYPALGEAVAMSYNGYYNEAGTFISTNPSYDTSMLQIKNTLFRFNTSSSVGNAPNIPIITGTREYFSVDLTQDATSITTGSLSVAGGAGIAKKLYVGSDITTAGGLQIGNNKCLKIGGTNSFCNMFVSYPALGETLALSYNGFYDETGTFIPNNTSFTTLMLQIKNTSFNFTASPSVGTEPNVPILSGNKVACYVSPTTESTSIDTGSLIVSGGLGISKKLWIGNGITSTLTTQASNTSTGSLIVAGGIGCAKDIYCANIFASNILSSGASTNINVGFTGAADNYVMCNVYKVGNMCTLTIPSWWVTTSFEYFYYAPAGSIPSGYCNLTTSLTYPIMTYANTVAFTGMMILTASGTITIYLSPSAHNFPLGIECGMYGISICYKV